MGISEKLFIAKAQKVFFNPSPLYEYDSIVEGCIVKDKFGDEWTMRAIDRNTWRGFHRINVNDDGPKNVYTLYFIKNKTKIIENLRNIESMEELNKLSNNLYFEINDLLKENIKNDMLVYNRVRVPIDLFLEHVISIANELSSCRKKLIPFLFVPLDEHTIKNCFTPRELIKEDLTLITTIADVDSPDEYNRLQKILYKKSVERTKEYGEKYYRIYSELLWNERYKNCFGGNLFETNLL